MRVYVESVLPCPAEKVWEEVQRPALLREIIRPSGDGQTLYSDEILIETGWVTAFVWLFAQWFYRHRQRRWRRVARRLVAAERAVAADGRPMRSQQALNSAEAGRC